MQDIVSLARSLQISDSHLTCYGNDKAKVSLEALKHRPQNGKLILEGETFHVCTGLDEKPKRLPEALAEKLRSLTTG